MIGDISKAEHIYIAVGYTDMRKQIDGLSAIVQQNFKLDPFSNSVFLFCGRNTRTMKALYWEGDGFVLLYKRLENGKFKWPRDESEAREITSQQFRWLLEGLSIVQPKTILSIPLIEDHSLRWRSPPNTLNKSTSSKY